MSISGILVPYLSIYPRYFNRYPIKGIIMSTFNLEASNLASFSYYDKVISSTH